VTACLVAVTVVLLLVFATTCRVTVKTAETDALLLSKALVLENPAFEAVTTALLLIADTTVFVTS
jgi:hypothetical protein